MNREERTQSFIDSETGQFLIEKAANDGYALNKEECTPVKLVFEKDGLTFSWAMKPKSPLIEGKNAPLSELELAYFDWCGHHHLEHSGHPVHDSAETIDFAEYYNEGVITAGEKDDDLAEFERLSRPLIKFLNERRNPHTSIRISTDSAELLSGGMAIHTDEFIED